jgi:XTP/dITP diphosphohydrolase
MEILFATKNQGKLREIKNALEAPGSGIHVISMEEAGITADVTEDGDTYEANALKKAETICGLSGMITLADDSGLEIDCLDRRPGVYSARYLGENTPYKEKNRIILEMITDVPDERRTARFVCVIAAAFPGGGAYTARGVIEGLIAREIGGGNNGFGYDPIFYVPEYGKTMSELPIEIKNAISHRGQALRVIKACLDGEEERGRYNKTACIQ